MARGDTESEFGKRWDRRIPRGDIKWLVSRYHVTASSAEIETDIRRRCTQPDFSERLIRQSIAYALACHERNRALFMRVVTGQLDRDRAH
jgi:hypothetical protein